MKNWLGQDINTGDYVYRGARDGNSSSFKVGRVHSVDNNVVAVVWLYRPRGEWVGGEYVNLPERLGGSIGRPDADTLFRIPDDEARRITEWVEANGLV